LNFPLLLFFVLFAPVSPRSLAIGTAMSPSQVENRDKNPEKTAAVEKSKQILNSLGQG
jgi:hypothetical protein